MTAGSSSDSVAQALADLAALPGALIVFNHPLWDLAGVGPTVHARLVRAFLGMHRPHLHALEINGYRASLENRSVEPLAAALGMPVVSGGDRHGLEPNRILNLTNATTFAAFAAEVRDGVSNVVVMPEYRRNLSLRVLSSAAAVLRSRRSRRAERLRWTDRVSWEVGGRVGTLSSRWPNGGSLTVRSAVAAFSVLTSPVLLPVTGSALLAADGSLSRQSARVEPFDRRAAARPSESDRPAVPVPPAPAPEWTAR